MIKNWIFTQSSMILSIGILVGGLLMMDTPAAGQDALGRGDVLDANLDRRTGGRNLPIDQPDFRRRNLTVTGDVAGGRGFRGDVGYRAPGDFAGDLATDDFFEFRARAARPMPRAVRPGETRDPFQLGRDFGVQEYRRTVGAMPTRVHDRMPTIQGDIPDAARITRDRMSPMVDELPIDRWTAGAMAGRALDTRIEPRTAGLTYDSEGRPIFFTTSPLRGIEQIAARDSLAMEGLTTYDRIRLREDELRDRLREPVGRPFERRFELLAMDEEFRLAPERAAAHDRVTGETDYVRLLERIARRYADDPRTSVSVDASLLRELDDQFEDLREQLMGMRQRGALAPEEAEEAIDEIERRLDPERAPDTEPRDPREDQRDELLPGIPRPGDHPEHQPRPEEDPDDRDVQDELTDRLDRLGLDHLADILRHGHPVQRLSGEEDGRFDELMRTGERALANGEFFTAEQRFQRALRLTPGHPMARVGVSHAQLGAELDRTAAHNLQRLLSAHPELIDVRYGPNLLPGEEHLSNTIERLQRNLRDGRHLSTSGFLLAYLGHQLDDRELVERGLAAFSRERADDPLERVLRAVWLEPSDEPRK